MKYGIHKISSFQFIINPSAGRGEYKHTVRVIHEILTASGVRYEIRIPDFKGEATAIAKEAAKRFDAVVAVGGDGTVNEVFKGVRDTEAALGVIPAGTGNGFATELGMPSDVAQACMTLLHADVKRIDVGRAGERFFVSTAGMGFDALISRAANKIFGPLRGMWLYFSIGALAFVEYEAQILKIKLDSHEIEVAPLLVAVANTRRYGGTAIIAPDAKPDDGLFDICVIKNMGAIRLLRRLPGLFGGNHAGLPEVEIYKSQRVRISTPYPIPMHVDGEPIGDHREMEFAVLPKALKVLVPKDLEPW